jgi:hypothetical protein
MKAKSAAKLSQVWDQWPEEMAKKFIIKRHSKQWPHNEHSERLAKTVGIINQYEGSDALTDKLDLVAARMLEAYYREEGADASELIEIWDELTDEEKITLYTAKSKGGWFEHKERQEIKQMLAGERARLRQLAHQDDEAERREAP